MLRWIVVAALGMVTLVGLYVAWSLSQPAVSGPAMRAVEPRIVWGSGAVDATLALNAGALPACATLDRSSDIILLVDRSSSMEANGAFDQALAAMTAFVEEVDLAASQVAILFFSDTVAAQPLTAERSLLDQTLLDRRPFGGTVMDTALLEAQRTLEGPNHRATVRPLVILLSDGGANDVAAAAATAATLNDAGIRLVTVALGSDPAGHSVMRDLASSPSDAHVPASPSELAGLYRSLAQGINSAVAFDVELHEHLNFDTFEVVPSSLQPAGTVDHDGVVWQLAALPQEENMFHYRLRATRLGLHHIAVADGDFSLTDCAGATPRWSLPPGPSVLVMPALAWLLLPLLLFLLSFFSFAFWRRKRRDDPGSELPPPPPDPGPPVQPDGVPVWLRALDERRIVLGMPPEIEKSTLQNTVLVGVGPAGRVVLSQIANVLRERFGGIIPANVRLLQVDVQLAGGMEPPAVEGVDQVVLQPRLDEVEENLRRDPQRWEHWKWYQATQPDYERTRSRMALFYDLRDGRRQSRLWKKLEEKLSGLPSPKVRLIGTTFDDTSSGMMVDVARLAHIVSQRNLDTELWLALPLDQAWSERLTRSSKALGRDDQRARSLAMLRELERFQRNALSPFRYVPESSLQPELRAEVGAIVHSLFLFEPRQPQPGKPIPAPEHDVFAVMIDSLLALLHPPVNKVLVETLQRNQGKAGTMRNDMGRGVAATIGCYAFRLPRGTLVDAMAKRFVHELLFDADAGLLRYDSVRADGSYETLNRAEWEADIQREELRRQADALVDQVAMSSYGLDSPAFTGRVRAELDRLLNGAVDDPLGHRNGLRRARLWLESTRSLVSRKQERGVAARIETLIEEFKRWETWLAETVYQASREQYRKARAPLEMLNRDAGRSWVVDEQLEWPLYRDHVRGGSGPEGLGLAARRFGWQVEGDTLDQLQLSLLVPPGDWIWHPHAALDSFTIRRTQPPATLLEPLLTVAARFAQSKANAALLLKEAGGLDPKQWIDQAAPRLSYNSNAASEAMNSLGEAYVLVGPEDPALTTIAAELKKEATGTWELVPTRDVSTVALLRIVDWIPLDLATKVYSDAQWREQSVPSMLYVWEAEQAAARLELRDKRLSAIAVGWLARDAEVVELFAQSYLYDVLRPGSRGWEVPGIGVVQGATPCEVLQTLLEDPAPPLLRQRGAVLDVWRAALAARQQAVEDQRTSFLKEARAAKVEPLLRSDDPCDQNLGRYLQGRLDKR